MIIMIISFSTHQMMTRLCYEIEGKVDGWVNELMVHINNNPIIITLPSSTWRKMMWKYSILKIIMEAIE
jgi:hypothetical protein